MHPGDQLTHAERLGQVVVRTGGQAHQGVGLVLAGGQHEDRDRSLCLHQIGRAHV